MPTAKLLQYETFMNRWIKYKSAQETVNTFYILRAKITRQIYLSHIWYDFERNQQNQLLSSIIVVRGIKAEGWGAGDPQKLSLFELLTDSL